VQLASAPAVQPVITPSVVAAAIAAPTPPPAVPVSQVQLAVVAPAAPVAVAAAKPVAVQALPRPSVKTSQARPIRQARLVSAPAVPPARPAVLALASISAPVVALPSRPKTKPPVLATTVRIQRKPVHASMPRVRVLNAVGRKGLANRYSHYLQSRGWSGLKTADARHPRAVTVIFYPAGARAQAAALARRLPFRATLAASRSGSEMLVLLGNNALAFDNRLRLRVSRT
jgi:hypothetical protein